MGKRAEALSLAFGRTAPEPEPETADLTEERVREIVREELAKRNG